MHGVWHSVVISWKRGIQNIRTVNLFLDTRSCLSDSISEVTVTNCAHTYLSHYILYSQYELWFFLELPIDHLSKSSKPVLNSDSLPNIRNPKVPFLYSPMLQPFFLTYRGRGRGGDFLSGLVRLYVCAESYLTLTYWGVSYTAREKGRREIEQKKREGITKAIGNTDVRMNQETPDVDIVLTLYRDVFLYNTQLKSSVQKRYKSQCYRFTHTCSATR